MYTCHRALLFGVRRKLSLPYRRCAGSPKSHDTVARTSDSSSPAETIPVEVKSIARGFFKIPVALFQAALVYPEFEETDLDRNRRIPEGVLYGFKKLGGLALCNKASSKLYAELGADLSIFTTFYVQNELVGKAICKFGSDEQKRRYLPLLASGSITGAVCLHEDACGEDIAKTETKAVVTEHSDRAFLSGTKTWLFARRAIAVGLVTIMEIFGASSSTAELEFERLLRDVTTLSSFLDACRFIEEVMYKFEHIIRSQLHVKGKVGACSVNVLCARFINYFQAIEDDCFTLKRLCEVGSSIFVMLAAVSRASRSYCIGLKNSDLEVSTVEFENLYCLMIFRYTWLTLYALYLMRRRIAGAVAIANGYPIVSPLEKNW
ncbi:Acyl-CoA dh N domain containing protein [Trichuris trichiura]|uniref:Acyl-CoA dh N domain containing protein n=1 Tax=Trichuris trichiura TaxID=36087 RepID=A0A077Z6C1_TRITR|nr:Acyl-CoA dh N domain containing protein [Trichuris trichiura]